MLWIWTTTTSIITIIRITRKIDNNSNSGNNPINNNSSPVPPSSNQFQTINSSNGEAGSNKNFKWDYPPTNLNSQPQQVSSSVKKVRVESFLSTWIIHISPRRAWVLVFSFWGIWVWVWSEMYICKAFIFVNRLKRLCIYIIILEKKQNIKKKLKKYENLKKNRFCFNKEK